MTYKTGFCDNGHCEGTAPVSYTGKPIKVCVAYEICECDCHKKFNKMYEMADVPRRLHQNPNYIPYEYPDMSEYFAVSHEEVETLSGGVVDTPEPRERPSTTAPGLLESARTFTGTPSGYRQRGQLEVEVQQICNRGMLGEFDEHLTPKLIAEMIDPDNPPSTGAIGAVFNRWERIGYARIHRKPLYFQGLTVEGMRDGLETLKRKSGRR